MTTKTRVLPPVDISEIETWEETETTLSLMKRYQPQLYEERVNAAIPDEESKHVMEQLKSAIERISCSSSSSSGTSCGAESILDGSCSANDTTTTMNAFPVDRELNRKVSLFSGDITALKVDCIVNAANAMLSVGKGVNGHVHLHCGDGFKMQSLAREALIRKRAADEGFSDDLSNLEQQDVDQELLLHVSEVIMTEGLALPSRKVLHVLGPVYDGGDYTLTKLQLAQCYHNCLEVMKNESTPDQPLRSIAFCCISCGSFGFPIVDAAQIALNTVREWLSENRDSHVDRVLFVVKNAVDEQVYECLLQQYFPTR